MARPKRTYTSGTLVCQFAIQRFFSIIPVELTSSRTALLALDYIQVPGGIKRQSIADLTGCAAPARKVSASRFKKHGTETNVAQRENHRTPGGGWTFVYSYRETRWFLPAPVSEVCSILSGRPRDLEIQI